MDWENIIITIGVGLTTGLSSFFLGRNRAKAEAKKYTAEAFNEEIEGLRGIIASWKDHTKSLEDHINKQEKLLQDQYEKMQIQREEIMELKRKIEELTDKINKQCSTCDFNNDKK